MNLVDSYQQSIGVFTDRVRQVRPDQWGAPTPCADWDVRTLTNHIVNEDRWTVPLIAGATIDEVGDRFEGDLLNGDPIGAAVEAATEAQMAVAQPGARDQTVHLSFGDTPADEYIAQLLADHLVHSWDLAVSVGADPKLPEAAVDTCARWFAQWEQVYRDTGAIGPRVAVAPAASSQDRLLAAFGRHPDWSPTAVVLDRFGAAFARGDVAAIMDLMTADCVFESTGPAPDGRRYQGQDAVRAVWTRLFSDTVDPSFDWEQVNACGDRGMVRWVFSWREPDGSRGHIRGADLLTVRAGKVAEKLSYVKG